MNDNGFAAWYKRTLGSKPVWLQGVLWFLYGFIWIPVWYANARGKVGAEVAQGDASTDLVALAPTGRRFLGFVVDLGLIVFVGLAFARLLYSGWDPYQRDRQSAEILQVGLANSFGWYYWLFEGINGRTIGKLITGTKVTRPNGTPAGWRVLVRPLVRLIPFEVLSLRNGVMWHDTLTGTRVICWPARSKAASTES